MNKNICGKNGKFKNYKSTLILFVFWLIIPVQINAQSYTPMALRPGSPAGSASLSGFETINPYSGNLNFSLPLIEAVGRGSTSLPINLSVNQKFLYKSWIDENDGNPYWYVEEDQWGEEVWGDKGYIPAKLIGARSGSGFRDSCPGQGPPVFDSTNTTLTFTSPDGTQYEMRDRNTNGQPYNVNCNLNGYYRGTIFDSVDGTSATFISDVNIRDEPFANLQDYDYRYYPTGNLMTRNGTLYRIESGLVVWSRDNNGNKITFTYLTGKDFKITDSLNREIMVEYAVQDVSPYGLCDRITYKGFDGADRVIRISYKPLHDLLRLGYNIQTGLQLFPGIFSTFFPYYFPEWNGSSNFDPTKVSSVWLPDDRSYKFQYNSYGEIAKVELPTGGAFEYDWEAYTGSGRFDNWGETSTRRVVERRVYSDGINLDNKLVLSGLVPLGNKNGYVTEDLYNGNSQLINRTIHYYHGIIGPAGVENPTSIPSNHFGLYEPWKNGREFQTDVFASDGTTLLRRSTNTWQQSTPYWSISFPNSAPTNNPHVIETTTLLADSNQISKRTFTYDSYNNLTDTYEYDFGIGAPGQFLRRSHIDYLTTNPVNNINYTDDNIHILNLPSQAWVSSDTTENNKVSLTTFEYDNYATDQNHAALVARSIISGHDSNYGTSYTTRGNVTMVRSFANAQNQTGAVSVYTQYDIAGNPVKTIDARGKITTIDYFDKFGSPDGEARNNSAPSLLNGWQTFAFATSATNGIGYTTYAQFDYYTGKGVDGEDINGNVSTTFYNDDLDRPNQVIVANNRSQFKKQTTVDYDDFNRKVTITSDSKIYNDNLIKAESYYDKMGRTTETRQYETASDIIATLQEYDALGRAYKSSNPFRPYLSEQPQWTTTKFDSLGRVIEVKTPDNAIVTRNYIGSTTTVTDQSLRKRSGTADALGRLSKVVEDQSGLNYETTYIYDIFGRLRKTTQIEGQITQNRYFMYNDLGRLIRAKQSEQNANSNLAITDPITGNSNWSVGYSYDNNGNITSTTDANNRTITGIYDDLNRLTFRDYSESSMPDVTFTFDDSNIANSKGQLTAVTSSVSQTYYMALDELGRVKSSQQVTNGNTYTMPDYTYDLSGALIAQTYHSGRVATIETDNIGRLSKVKGQVPNHAERTYLSDISYTSFGAVEKTRLGNGAWESAQFDPKRLQVTQIGLGASNGDTSYLKLEYNYGTTDNNGSLRQHKITVPGMSAQLIQHYSYDMLNRLQSATETKNGSQTIEWKQTFSYDRFGNRGFDANNTTTLLANNGIYNPQFDKAKNQFTVAEGYNYDNEGNLTSNPESQLFTYDAENRQTQVNNTATQTTANYFYDGNGKRVRKVVGNQETIFVYDAFGKLIAEYTTNQTITTEGTKYLTVDALGSPRAITDIGGHVASRHDYMPFGEEVASNVGGRTSGQGYLENSDGIRQQFTGYEKDEESGLDYAQARYFSSKHGRFTSVDPLTASAGINNPQTFNRYSYGLNSPYKFTDPLGLKPCKIIGGGNTACIQEGDDPIPYIEEQVTVYANESNNQSGGCSAEFAGCASEGDGPATWDSDEAPKTYNWRWDVFREGGVPCEGRGSVVCMGSIFEFSVNPDADSNIMLNGLYAEAFSYYYSLEILDAMKDSVGGELAELTVSAGGKIGFTGDSAKPITGDVNMGVSGKVTFLSIQKLKGALEAALHGKSFHDAASKLAQLTFMNPKTGKTESVRVDMARDMIGLVKSKAKEQAVAAGRDWIRRTTPK